MARDPEDLRQRVDELEATVRGLTQELVEANERIRVLEEGEEEPSADRPMAEKGEASSDETESATEEQDEEDDIIIA